MDGFSLAYAVTPGSFEDFVEHVVPELRRRGRARDGYPAETLRENLGVAPSPLLADEHTLPPRAPMTSRRNPRSSACNSSSRGCLSRRSV